MKKTLLFLIYFLLIQNQTNSQSLWNLGYRPGETWDVAGDTSIQNLVNILNDTSLISLDFPNQERYLSAAQILAVNHGSSERSFISAKLNRFANFNSPNFKWEYYYKYQQIRGFLGDSGAIAGMDSIVRFSPELTYRLNAIGYLSVVGKFEYYDTVKKTFLTGSADERDNAIELLGYYGKDSRFSDEASNLLGEIVSDSTTRVGPGGISAISTASVLAKFNKPRAIQLLNQRFQSSIGEERLDFFIELQSLDSAGQPERSMYVVPLESDEITRSLYIPIYSMIKNNNYTKRFIQPFYIKFVKDQWQTETSTMIKWNIKDFLDAFIPTRLPDTVALSSYLDTLISLKNQVTNYGWLGDSFFSIQLDNILTTIHNYIVAGDSNNCGRQIKFFQQGVDSVYNDSTHANNRFLTPEGWKFLHYNAQYILDRLPVPPSQFKLNMNINGNGGVNKSPNYDLYDSANTVQLTAIPSTGYFFSSWSGDASSSTNPLPLVMNGNMTVTATFIQSTFVITASTGANGTISPSGEVNVNYGASQIFTITPNTGYHIDSVFVDNIYVGNLPIDTISNVTANHSISAKFAINQYTLTIQLNGSGTVLLNPNQSTYSYGASVQLTAKAATGSGEQIVKPQLPAPKGWKFDHWELDASGTANPITITMNANKNVRAVFVPTY